MFNIHQTRVTSIAAALLFVSLSSGGAFAQTPSDSRHPDAVETELAEATTGLEMPIDWLGPAAGASLQDAQGAPRTGVGGFFHSVAHDFGAMPTMKSTYAVLGGAGLVAAAVHGQDNKVNAHFRGGNTGFFKAGKYLGQSYTIGAIAVSTLLIGRATDNEKTTHIGYDELRALLESELIVQGLKYTVRRERPEGSGFAFPSGHSADSFAAATVLQRHFGAKAAIPMYTLASYIAMSRLYENRHYLSDVIFGAGVGYVVGHTVTRHGKKNFRGFAMFPTAGPDGVGISFTRVTP
jgi:hypothetical protein